jgi:uncharacterized Fe-S radical SAM superfamily protein PflX
MAQYRPQNLVGRGRYDEIDRALSASEYRAALELAATLGLLRIDERNALSRSS